MHARGTTNDDTERERLADDFRRLRAMGFNAVWLDFGIGDEQEVAAGSAGAAGLRPILCDRRIDRYIRFGRLPSEQTSIEELVMARVRTLRSRQPAAMLALPPFPSGEMVDRVFDVAHLLADTEPPCETLLVGYGGTAGRFSEIPTIWYAAKPSADTPIGCDSPAPHLISVLGHSGDNTSSWADAPARLAYYRALAAGLTDGLIVWRFRSWPGEANGLAESDGRIAPGTANVMKRIAERAAEWGPRLAGTRRITEPGLKVDSNRLRCTAFRRPGRRFILVHNEDTEHFARGTLRVPATLGGEPLSRIVDQDTGTRHLRSDSTLTIPMHLAPAQAVLFEVH